MITCGCGASVDPTDKFCRTCGAMVAGDDLRGLLGWLRARGQSQRKTVETMRKRQEKRGEKVPQWEKRRLAGYTESAERYERWADALEKLLGNEQ